MAPPSGSWQSRLRIVINERKTRTGGRFLALAGRHRSWPARSRAPCRVTVGEMVAHSSNLAPGDSWLSVEKFGRQGLDSFSDLEQPDPNRIEYEPVSESAALEVRADRVDGRLDIRQPLAFSIAHSSTRSRTACDRTSGLRSREGIKSTRTPRMLSNSACKRPKPNKLMCSGRSTSRSTSLSARSSPRATLPNTRNPDTP
jgi:hypothetical protein